VLDYKPVHLSQVVFFLEYVKKESRKLANEGSFRKTTIKMEEGDRLLEF